jgi:hypothetical protein
MKKNLNPDIKNCVECGKLFKRNGQKWNIWSERLFCDKCYPEIKSKSQRFFEPANPNPWKKLGKYRRQILEVEDQGYVQKNRLFGFILTRKGWETLIKLAEKNKKITPHTQTKEEIEKELIDFNKTEFKP